MNNLVTKKIADKFWVKKDDQFFCCIARGGLKADGIFVGDHVEINTNNNPVTIERVLPRKNKLIRPPLANLDQLIIVIASEPKPDFMIIDKLILFALCYGITPVICVNKIDMGEELYKQVKVVYKNAVKQIIATSTKTNQNIDKLKKIMQGKVSAFAGQSAVGKSALINSLFGENSSQVGELSKKIKRGKNTTRHTEIFCENNIYISDTAGFTSLDEKLLPISYFELTYYYPDFVKIMDNCKYKSCVHMGEAEKDCAIKKAVKNGDIAEIRYQNYQKIYQILQKEWVKNHG